VTDDYTAETTASQAPWTGSRST